MKIIDAIYFLAEEEKETAPKQKPKISAFLK